MPFNSLGLSTDLVANVTAKGYTTPTPIQKRAIPAIIAGKDILAGAQTGTGKTAAFALPIIQEMVSNPRAKKGQRELRCLVITPTRELAAQVGESFEHYSKGTGIQTSVIFGGVGQNPQVSAIRRGLDVLVATPGRLLDLNQQGLCPLKTVDILVLDEADRMLDMGFIHDIRKIIKELPVKRQNLLFSATYSDEIRRLASNILVNPELIDVAPRNAIADQVDQSAYNIAKGMKRALLSQLIRNGQWYQVLVFTRTKHGANRLAKQLENDGIPSAAIHGNKSQSARTKALASFKKGDLQALVATDIAARGLDIKELPLVVNYELPNVPEDYIHRIGRTGRAGLNGQAISLVCEEEAKYLRDIEKLLKRQIPREVFKEKIEILATDKPSESEDRRDSRPGNRQNNRQARPGRGRGHENSRKNLVKPAAQENPRQNKKSTEKVKQPSGGKRRGSSGTSGRSGNSPSEDGKRKESIRDAINSAIGRDDRPSSGFQKGRKK